MCCFSLKKSRKLVRISAEVMTGALGSHFEVSWKFEVCWGEEWVRWPRGSSSEGCQQEPELIRFRNVRGSFSLFHSVARGTIDVAGCFSGLYNDLDCGR